MPLLLKAVENCGKKEKMLIKGIIASFPEEAKSIFHAIERPFSMPLIFVFLCNKN